MPDWITSFGYLGFFIGAILEGELVLLTAVQTARMGYLNVYLALTCVFAGTVAVDWSCYLIGRHRGRSFIERSEKLQRKFERMQRLFENKGSFLLFVYRFMYGFRIVLPVLFGVSNVHPIRFATYSLASTLLWVVSFGLLGYHFAGWVLSAVQEVQTWWWLAAIPLAVLGLVFAYRRPSEKATSGDSV